MDKGIHAARGAGHGGEMVSLGRMDKQELARQKKRQEIKRLEKHKAKGNDTKLPERPGGESADARQGRVSHRCGGRQRSGSEGLWELRLCPEGNQGPHSSL